MKDAEWLRERCDEPNYRDDGFVSLPRERMRRIADRLVELERELRIAKGNIRPKGSYRL